MRRRKIGVLLLVSFLLATAGDVVGHDHKGKDDRFYYDEVSRLLNGAMLEEQGYYEPSAARHGDLIRVAMLEFESGAGDRIVVGTLKPGGALANKRIVTAEEGQYRRPRLTADGRGTLRLGDDLLMARTPQGLELRFSRAGELTHILLPGQKVMPPIEALNPGPDQ